MNYQFLYCSLKTVRCGNGGRRSGVDSDCAKRFRAIPLHTGGERVPRASCMCCVCARHFLEESKRIGRLLVTRHWYLRSIKIIFNIMNNLCLFIVKSNLFKLCKSIHLLLLLYRNYAESLCNRSHFKNLYYFT